jgi:nucleoid-associated protein YgaU
MAGAAAVGAAIGGGYYASRTSEPPAETAAAPAAPAAEAPAAEPSKQGEPVVDSDMPEPEAAQAPADVPTFSVLRVEKDGSAVVAGSAKPDTKIDLVSGGNVIASAQAGPSGDFAIVLDEPLAPGAHELSLRATDPSGTAVTSQETGIVNVPQGDGELVAMVAKAGEASRVMQAGDQDAEAAIAAVEAEVKAEQQAAAATEPSAQPATETQAASDAPAAASQTEAPAAQAPAAGTETAATQTQDTQTAAPAPVEETRPVLVSAVDFEDGKIYIAGTGEPGRTVNIYIDGAMTGSAVVGPDGAFLLEAPSQLAPGDHTIRADLLSADGSAVAARAEVPLVHEAPTEVAAAEQKPVAASETAAAEPGTSAGASGTTQPAGDTAASAAPAADAGAATPSAGTDTAQTNAATSAAAGAASGSEAPAATAGDAATSVAPAAEEPAAAAQDTASAAPAASAESPAVAAQEPAASSEPPATETSAAPAAIEQEPIKTGASVIIRRGDNLWRISRRMLGKGIRYTTIYEANRDQIKNPSLIYPGQVFQVPGATSVN